MHLAHQKLFSLLSYNTSAIVVIQSNKECLTPSLYRSEHTSLAIFFYKLQDIKSLNAKEFLKLLYKDFPNLNTIVVGYDFHFGYKAHASSYDLKDLFGGKVKIVDQFFYKNISIHSSKIRELLQNGDITYANKLLGYHYKIVGSSIKGQGLGSKTFVATINLTVDKFLLPKNGIYATKTTINNISYYSVSFLGHRQTTDNKYAIETHIIEPFNKQLKNNTTVTIEFFNRIRDNIKFQDFNSLKKQILNDIEKSKYFFNTTIHEQYLDLAITKAWTYELLTYPNPAVGAVIVENDKILSVEAHKKSGKPHAEVLALKEAYIKKYPNSILKTIVSSQDIHSYLIKNHNDCFKNCTIYVTLEPCNHIGKTPSCAMLLRSVGIKKVYIGVKDPNRLAAGGIDTLKKSNIVTILLNSKKAQKLLDPFIKWQKNQFIFFKLAIKEDGSHTNGYITTKQSLKWVHKIRTKIDLLVIGGQTVRIDRPTLDSRFIDTNKAPNICIYSKNKNFDKTIPLFNIPNRDLCISDNLDILKDKNFIMIEGGYNLYRSLKNKIDYLVLFVSSKDKTKNKIDIEKTFGLKIVFSYAINQYDTIIFLD